MFDINSFLSTAPKGETKVVYHGTEEFKIKRLDGEERLRYGDLQSRCDQTLFALAHCVLSGSADSPIGDEYAVQLLKKHDRLANLLVADIENFTLEVLREEEIVWADAKKKSTAPTDTSNSSDGNTVGVTG